MRYIRWGVACLVIAASMFTILGDAQAFDNRLLSWGRGIEGQLGNGSNSNSFTPVQVSNLSEVTAISGGPHNLALQADGSVWAWGKNQYGQLGDATTSDRNAPVRVANLSGITAVSSGGSHSLALKSDGTVWAWGRGYYAQLGQGSTADRSTPVQVSLATTTTAIAAGEYHSLALTSDGSVYFWGYKVCRNGDSSTAYYPVKVDGLEGVTAISAGLGHSLALKSDGTVWAWGSNFWGQLGDGWAYCRNTPAQVVNLSGAVAISAGGDLSLAVVSDGTVRSWGVNHFGQLGNGTPGGHNSYSTTPMQVSGLAGVVAVSAGPFVYVGGNNDEASHAMAWKSDGTVWAWGYGADGQLGNGSGSSSNVPIKAYEGKVSGFSAGDRASYVIESARTEITSGPAAFSSSTEASFSFISDVENSTFECSLDGAAFSACVSPKSYVGLSEGSRTFLVRAIEPNGDVDSTPASWIWTIDTTPPQTSIDSGPSGTVSSPNASFSFSSNELSSSFECSLDSAAFTQCASPANYSGLIDGSHNFRVRSLDRAGSVDPTPAIADWVIEPDTVITSAPISATGPNLSFSFNSTLAGSMFECSLDFVTFESCFSPKAYSGVDDGPHTFRVRAIGPGGTTDSTPASRSFTVDSIPPETTITAGPSGTVTSQSATFSFTSNEAGHFECRLDSKQFSPCTSPKIHAAVSEGTHTFEVRAIDSAGNVDSTPAIRTWLADYVGPILTILRPMNGLYLFDQLLLAGTQRPIAAGPITVEVRAVDAETGVSTFNFEVNLVPVDPSLVTYDPSQKTYRFTYQASSAGTSTITARARNGSGIETSASIAITSIPL